MKYFLPTQILQEWSLNLWNFCFWYFNISPYRMMAVGPALFFLRHLYLQFWRRVAVARKFLLYLFAFNVPVDTSFLFHPLSPLVDRPHVGVQTSANGGIKSAVITRLRNFSTAHWRQNFEWGSWTGEFNLKWKCWIIFEGFLLQDQQIYVKLL